MCDQPGPVCNKHYNKSTSILSSALLLLATFRYSLLICSVVEND